MSVLNVTGSPENWMSRKQHKIPLILQALTPWVCSGSRVDSMPCPGTAGKEELDMGLEGSEDQGSSWWTCAVLSAKDTDLVPRTAPP